MFFVSRNFWSLPPPYSVQMGEACLENTDVGKQMLSGPGTRVIWEGQALVSSEHAGGENRMDVREHPASLPHFKSEDTETQAGTEKAGGGSLVPPRRLRTTRGYADLQSICAPGPSLRAVRGACRESLLRRGLATPLTAGTGLERWAGRAGVCLLNGGFFRAQKLEEMYVWRT